MCDNTTIIRFVFRNTVWFLPYFARVTHSGLSISLPSVKLYFSSFYLPHHIAFSWLLCYFLEDWGQIKERTLHIFRFLLCQNMTFLYCSIVFWIRQALFVDNVVSSPQQLHHSPSVSGSTFWTLLTTFYTSWILWNSFQQLGLARFSVSDISAIDLQKEPMSTKY